MPVPMGALCLPIQSQVMPCIAQRVSFRIMLHFLIRTLRQHSCQCFAAGWQGVVSLWRSASDFFVDTAMADVHFRASTRCDATFYCKLSFSDSCCSCLFTLISSKNHPRTTIPVESTTVLARYADLRKSDLDLDKPGEVSR